MGTPGAGHSPLTGEDLQRRIADKVVWGDYLHGFQFVAFLDRNGTMEGQNNVGAHHFGEWSINMDDGSFTVRWNGGWDNTTTYAYDVEGEIRFHDTDTLQWRTTFRRFADKSSLQTGARTGSPG